MVGTFYALAFAGGRRPSSRSDSACSAGQTLCIIEAMKLMNQIEAEVSGVLAARLVDRTGSRSSSVKPMFKIRPA
jgi:acetyl-CoA carboxylase biotin carboxyl carrier protein